jgi:hypothetical protein
LSVYHRIENKLEIETCEENKLEVNFKKLTKKKSLKNSQSSFLEAVKKAGNRFRDLMILF